MGIGILRLRITARLVLLVFLNSAFIAAAVLIAIVVILDHEGETNARLSLDSAMRVAWNELRHQGQDYRVDDGILMAGEIRINGNHAMVDKIVDLVGGAATIFVGDVRTATTIKNASGSRADGTTMAHNAAYKSIFVKHQAYRGVAEVLGEPYVTAYHPIVDKEARVIRVLFVGIPQNQFFKSLEKAKLWVTASILAAGAVSFLLAVFLVRSSVSSPITAITATMKGLASGDHSRPIPGTQQSDEIGEMAQAVKCSRKTPWPQRLAAQQETTMRQRRDAERPSNC